MNTIIEYLKKHWVMDATTLRKLGIDPNKNWNQITLGEFGTLAIALDCSVAELLEEE